MCEDRINEKIIVVTLTDDGRSSSKLKKMKMKAVRKEFKKHFKNVIVTYEKFDVDYHYIG
jgi:uncharacterized protein with GYD domain